MSRIPLAILLYLITHSVSVCFGQDAPRRPSLSVVISAGQPGGRVRRVREIAVIIHGLSDAEKREGRLFIYRDQRRRRRLLRAPLRNLESEESFGSIKVFTGLTFKPTSWRPSSIPSGNVSYFTEVWLQNGVVVDGCLRVQPRWVEELLPQIRRLPLLNMAIPSTHQSGTYKVYNSRDIGDPFRDCQEEDVFTQLLYGIRALDLRVPAVENVSSSYAETTKNDLTKIFEDVRDFLDLFPNEVVFVDFHDVPAGCQDLAAFNRLVMLSRQILGRHLYDTAEFNPASTTLGNVIQAGKRAIVTASILDPSRIQLLGVHIYPGITHIFSNTDNLDRLKRTITDGQIRHNKEQHWFYNSMAQITPHGSDAVLLAKYPGGVREIAHRDNFKLSTWFRYNREARTNANFIAFDFFASSDLVDLCREINLERARMATPDHV